MMVSLVLDSAKNSPTKSSIAVVLFINSSYQGWFQYTMVVVIYILTTHRNIHTGKGVKHGYTFIDVYVFVFIDR